MSDKLTVNEVINNDTVPHKFKQALVQVLQKNRMSYGALLLVKSPGNNDINGSQHHPDRIIFGYDDATLDDIQNAVSLGGYNYFFERGRYFSGDLEGKYTGNQYNDHTGYAISGVVINPPVYAIEVNL